MQIAADSTSQIAADVNGLPGIQMDCRGLKWIAADVNRLPRTEKLIFAVRGNLEWKSENVSYMRHKDTPLCLFTGV
jgi:hypothetical protein